MKSDNKDRLVMIFPMNTAAHYLRCLELCKRISKKYRVAIVYSEIYDDFCRRTGVETFKAENFDPDAVMASAEKFDFSWLNIGDLRRILDSQIHAMEEFKPDYVLGDTSPPLRMAAESTGTKFVSLLNGYMTKHYKLTRPVSRTHRGYQYSRQLPPKLFAILTRMIEYMWFRRIHDPFRRIRKEFGLRQRRYYLDEFDGDINLICDMPELYPQRKMPRNYTFIGPLFHQSGDREAEVLKFLGDHHPNLLLTMGSTGKWDKLEFLNRKEFQNFRIIVSGDKAQTVKGSNVLSRPFINHTAVLDKIDLMICHGGNGTIYQALSCGVPAICITSIFEQEWNAQRIEDLGLGVLVDDVSDVGMIEKLLTTWVERKNRGRLSTIRERIATILKQPIYLEPRRT